MPWLEAAAPVRMQRVALVAPAASLRDVLVGVADAGAIDIDQSGQDGDTVGLSGRLLRAAGREHQAPALSATLPGPGELDRAGRYDLPGALSDEGLIPVAVGLASEVAGVVAVLSTLTHQQADGGT